MFTDRFRTPPTQIAYRARTCTLQNSAQRPPKCSNRIVPSPIDSAPYCTLNDTLASEPPQSCCTARVHVRRTERHPTEEACEADSSTIHRVEQLPIANRTQTRDCVRYFPSFGVRSLLFGSGKALTSSCATHTHGEQSQNGFLTHIPCPYCSTSSQQTLLIWWNRPPGQPTDAVIVHTDRTHPERGQSERNWFLVLAGLVEIGPTDRGMPPRGQCRRFIVY